MKTKWLVLNVKNVINPVTTEQLKKVNICYYENGSMMHYWLSAFQVEFYHELVRIVARTLRSFVKDRDFSIKKRKGLNFLYLERRIIFEVHEECYL